MSSTTLHPRPASGAVTDSYGEPTTLESRTSLPSVASRSGSIVDPAIIRLSDDAAVKVNALPNRSGYSSGMSRMQTHLHVEVWLKNLTYAKNAWIDVHVLDGVGELLHAETLTLRYARPAGDGGDFFVLDHLLYYGSVATQGSIELRPDARTVQYYVYGEMGERVFSDGILHVCIVRPDYEST
jgi:hypothetical protein